MGNNFRKMIIIHKGSYYEIDKKSEFHQAACKHKYIKGQIVRTAGDVARDLARELEEKGKPEQAQAILKYSKEQHMDKQPIGPIVDNMIRAILQKSIPKGSISIGKMVEGALGRLPKSVNLCKKCGKVKKRNN